MLRIIFLLLSVGYLFSDPPEDGMDRRELLHKMERTHLQRLVSIPSITHSFDVLHYKIDITVDIPNDSIWANTEITIESKSDSLDTLQLHFLGLTVDSILVDSISVSFTHSDSILYLDSIGPYSQDDTFGVRVFYHGTPFTGGGWWESGLIIDPEITYTFVEPYGAKRWFPLWDLPDDKATSELIVTVPQGYKVVANGSLGSTDTLGSWWTYNWQENYPIANYLIAFAASNDFYTWRDTFYYNADTMPVEGYLLSYHSSYQSKFDNTVDMLQFFSDTFAVYPFIDEKYAHVEASLGGAMEHQTNTFITIANWGADWDWVVAHELAHHWWGDWVTCGTWADIWLNEGFATYCEALYLGNRDGEWRYHQYMKDNIMDYYLAHEPYPPYPIYDPDYLFGTTSYEKGASVLHMLRHTVQDSVFFDILQEYGQRYSYSTATTDSFQYVSEYVSGMDLDWFFNEWVYSPGHPEYEYSWSYDSITPDSFLIDLTINQVQNHSYGVPTFIMPIDIGIVINGDTTIHTVWDSLDSQSFSLYVNGRPDNLLFDPYNWILKEVTPVIVREERNYKPSREASLSFSSNPTREDIRILFITDEPGILTAEIYDISGRKVFDYSLNVNAGDRISILWGTKELRDKATPQGVYIVRYLLNGRQRGTKTFVML